jgi:hypothetical protein
MPPPLPVRTSPIPRQELSDPLGRMILHSREDIGEPSLWINVVELGGLDQGVDCRGTSAAFIRTGECPVTATDRYATQRPLSSIVGHTEATVVEEARESAPAIEAILDRLGDLVTRGELAAVLAQPGFECADQRPAAHGAHAPALLRQCRVDLALDGEQRIDTLDRLDRDRHFVDPRRIEELAPGVCPA